MTTFQERLAAAMARIDRRRLQTYLVWRDTTLTEVAQRFKIPVSTIQSQITGVAPLPPGLAEKLEEVLELPEGALAQSDGPLLAIPVRGPYEAPVNWDREELAGLRIELSNALALLDKILKVSCDHP